MKEIAEIEEINTSKVFRKFLEIEQNFDEENDLLFLKTNEKPQKFQNYYKNIGNNINNNMDINLNNINNGINNRYEEVGNEEQNYINKK